MAKLAETNPSLILHGIEDLRIEDRALPTYGDFDALVAVAKTGICGSDVHYLRHARIGDFVLKEPMCLGHESAGVIVALGASVSGLHIGDKVAMEPGVSCGSCHVCKRGQYELCPHMKFAATPPSVLGTLAKYYTLPAHLLHLLPENVSLEEGAMMEPLAVGVHSVHTLGQCRSNQTVIVFGAGPIGLLCMAVARALGARRIIAVDVMQNKLEFAKAYAATDTFLPPPRNPDETPDMYTVRAVADMRKTLGVREGGPGSIDLAIEASGAPTCVQMGCTVLAPGGRYIQVGLGGLAMVPIPLFHVINKELQVLGSFRYGPGAYEMAISLVERGLIDVKPLITQRYKFEESRAAFDATKTGKDATGKMVIKCLIDGPL